MSGNTKNPSFYDDMQNFKSSLLLILVSVSKDKKTAEPWLEKIESARDFEAKSKIVSSIKEQLNASENNHFNQEAFAIMEQFWYQKNTPFALLMFIQELGNLLLKTKGASQEFKKLFESFKQPDYLEAKNIAKKLATYATIDHISWCGSYVAQAMLVLLED